MKIIRMIEDNQEELAEHLIYFGYDDKLKQLIINILIKMEMDYKG